MIELIVVQIIEQVAEKIVVHMHYFLIDHIIDYLKHLCSFNPFSSNGYFRFANLKNV